MGPSSAVVDLSSGVWVLLLKCSKPRRNPPEESGLEFVDIGSSMLSENLFR